MVLTASKLREDVYRVLDKALKTGIPVEIERKGRRLRIVPVRTGSKLARLKPAKLLKCDPEKIVHMNWSKEWRKP